MNNKELVAKLSSELGTTQTEANLMTEEFVRAVANQLIKSKPVQFQGFGSLEVRKREERISVNPVTQKRSLVPPKLAIAFKMSNTLKDKINNKEQ